MIAAGLRFGGLAAGLEATCERCTARPGESDDEREHRLACRARWGCDAELDRPLLQFDCWACNHQRPLKRCTRCHGTGKVEIKRCPWSLVEREHHQVIDGVVLLEQGVLPAAGGWADQAASWHEATVVALNEKAEYERLERERADRKAKAASARRR